MVNINYKLAFLILFSSLLVTSCALVSTSTTNSVAFKQLAYVKTAAEIVSLSYTDKSTTDHAISIALKKDCKVLRIIKREEICLEYGPNVFYKNKNLQNTPPQIVLRNVDKFEPNVPKSPEKMFPKVRSHKVNF